MKPKEYLDFYHNQIVDDLFGCGMQNSEKQLFQLLYNFIDEVTPFRNDSKKSRAIAKEFYLNTMNAFSDQIKDIAIDWLLKSFKHDITYIYVNNWLAQNENRKEGVVIYPINIDFLEAERLLLNEVEKENQQELGLREGLTAVQINNVTKIQMNNQVNIDSNPSTKEPNHRKGEKEAIENFVCLMDDEYLRRLYKGLTQDLDFIDEEQTSMDQFIQVLTTDWSSQDFKIYWKCETTQLAYLIEKVKTYFRNLTALNIEKSNKFISKKGIIITASNLYTQKSKTKDIDVKEKARIDKIIKSLIKEQ